MVIGGRPSMGKSSLAATMYTQQIMKGLKPAIFSFELSRKEIMDKIISMMTEFAAGEVVPFKSIFNPGGSFGGAVLSNKQLTRIGEITSKYLFNSEVFIRGRSKSNIQNIHATCRRLKADNCIDAFYIDHIGLLVQDKRHAREELENITNGTKLFAAEINVPAVEIVQLNRDVVSGKTKPNLAHLKGAGSIEEDADIVVFPWRPHAIDPEGSPAEDAEIILAKGRNAGTGILPAYFSTLTTTFTIKKEDEQPEEVDHWQ